MPDLGEMADGFHIAERTGAEAPVEVVTFGCRLNACESQAIRERAAADGVTGVVVFNVVIALLLTGLGTFVTRGQLDAPNPNAAGGVGAALKPYAYQLFTTYLLPVQVMGFLLLIAMLGVIVLSRKIDGPEDAK